MATGLEKVSFHSNPKENLKHPSFRKLSQGHSVGHATFYVMLLGRRLYEHIVFKDFIFFNCLKLVFLFIYLWLYWVICCIPWALVAASGGSSLVVVHQLLIVGASLAVAS